MESLLKQFNLTQQEIVVFKILLKTGGAKVSDIAKQANIKRTSCQEYIRGLVEKGLVNYSKIGNRYFYQTEDPDKFRQIISERQFTVDRLLENLCCQPIKDIWQVRSLDKAEADKNIKKAKRKGLKVVGFGSKKADGFIINDSLVILLSDNINLPAIEINSKDIAKFHNDILNKK